MAIRMPGQTNGQAFEWLGISGVVVPWQDPGVDSGTECSDSDCPGFPGELMACNVDGGRVHV
jgi:hypothetical protein